MEQGRVYTCSATSDFLNIDLGRPIVKDTCSRICNIGCPSCRANYSDGRLRSSPIGLEGTNRSIDPAE